MRAPATDVHPAKSVRARLVARVVPIRAIRSGRLIVRLHGRMFVNAQQEGFKECFR
ncbi:hypothetical protein BRPE64_ACDS23340 [Caballeronia insecticola]|uniref:Uncharacterized protein n=1 Tax=Caballeronia insecticola TaxID=758793 RepID=R4WIB5_9BURK|nr:hypothetical protein BRPE64_ACDS23340 [Caballeronia insecticola]